MALKDLFRRHSKGNADPTVLTEQQIKEEEANMEKVFDDAGLNTAFYEREKLTPLEEAVKNNDVKRLLSYAKDYTSKMTPEVLASAYPFVSSPEVFDILTTFAPAPQRTIPTIAENMLKKLKENKAGIGVLKFFKGNDISMNFRYEEPFSERRGLSLYDYAKNKEDWIELATVEEIGQELNSALSAEDFSKTRKLFEVSEAYGKPVDLNKRDKDKLTIMSYARDFESIMFLYNRGGKLYKENSSGLNAFERIGPKARKKLLLECLEKGDVMGLASAVKAGIPLNDTSYLLKTKNPEALAFLAGRGASIDKAISSLGNSKKDLEQVSVLAAAKEILARREATKQVMTPQQRQEIEHEFRQAVMNGTKGKVLKMLIKYDGILNIDAQNRNGSSALMYAAKMNDIGMINLLSQFGANLLLKDKEGKNFINYADTKSCNNLLAKYIDEGNTKGAQAVVEAGHSFSSSFEERARLSGKTEIYNILTGEDNNATKITSQILKIKNQKTA